MSRAGRPATGNLPESARFVATALRYFGPSSYGTIRYAVGYLMEVEDRSRSLKLADMTTKRGLDALRKLRFLYKRADGLYEMHTPTTAVVEAVIQAHQRFQFMVARLGGTDPRVDKAWQELKELTNRVHFTIPRLLSGTRTPEGSPVEPHGLFFEESSSTTETDPAKVAAWAHRGFAYYILGVIGSAHQSKQTAREKAAYVRSVVRNRRLAAAHMALEPGSPPFAVPPLENPIRATKPRPRVGGKAVLPRAPTPPPKELAAPPGPAQEARHTPNLAGASEGPRPRRRPAGKRRASHRRRSPRAS